MLSQKWSKFIKSLQIKKNRQAEQSFLIEGGKSVREALLAGYSLQLVAGTERFLSENKALLASGGVPAHAVDEAELARLGSFQTNNAALAVASMPPNTPLHPGPAEMLLALDGVQDPGNLGTVVRIADWYGISKIICSPDTVDVYNPKAVAATMGSFIRVALYYCPLEEYLRTVAAQGVAVYGAAVGGSSLHQVPLAAPGLILLGSEAHGLRPGTAAHVTQRVGIPRFGGAESLNVAVAAAVFCDNWRRGV